MLNLFKMEFLKHLPWMTVAAVLHLLILYYLFSAGAAFTSGLVASQWVLVISIFGGGFGVVQMWQHKRSNEWIYLLHRPVAPARIHLALALAGTALLLVVVILPAALMLFFIDVDGMNGIEARHYQLLVYGGCALLTGHGLGQFAVLGHSRLAFFGFILVLTYIFRPFENSEKFVAPLFLLLWAGCVAHVSFKPDLARPPATPACLVLSELPVYLGCYTLVVLTLSIFVNLSGTANSLWRHIAPDTVRQVSQLDGQAKMTFALQRSTHPDAAFLQQQIGLGTVVNVINGNGTRLPKRFQLPIVDSKHILFDAQRNVRWIFSHAAMLYHGVNTNTGAAEGWLGPAGFHAGPDLPETRFADIPLAVTNDYLVDSHHIYQIDWRDSAIKLRFTREGPGRFWDTLTTNAGITTLFSDAALYIFSTSDFVDFDKPLVARAVIDLRSRLPMRNGETWHIAELINGYLIGGLADAHAFANAPQYVTHGYASLQLYRTGHVPQSELIATVPLVSDYTALTLHALLAAAPGISVLTDLYWGFKLSKPVEQTVPVLYADLPRWVLPAIALVCLLSAALTAWLLRSSVLPRRLKLTWILLNGFSGLPGLIGFVAGSYWRGAEQLQLGRGKPVLHGIAAETIA